jgi:hypothetical protein
VALSKKIVDENSSKVSHDRCNPYIYLGTECQTPGRLWDQLIQVNYIGKLEKGQRRRKLGAADSKKPKPVPL